jgi:hypothetical protein
MSINIIVIVEKRRAPQVWLQSHQPQQDSDRQIAYNSQHQTRRTTVKITKHEETNLKNLKNGLILNQNENILQVKYNNVEVLYSKSSIIHKKGYH